MAIWRLECHGGVCRRVTDDNDGYDECIDERLVKYDDDGNDNGNDDVI